jgi:hypothetical protein
MHRPAAAVAALYCHQPCSLPLLLLLLDPLLPPHPLLLLV